MSEKKLIMNLNDDIYNLLEKTKTKMMISRTPIVRLAIKDYCEKVLKNENG